MMSEQVWTGYYNNMQCLLPDVMPLTSSLNLAHFILSFLFPCHLTTNEHKEADSKPNLSVSTSQVVQLICN